MERAPEGRPSVSISAEDRQSVREQLNRLIETHHFKNSRRYPALLRFIVEETLEGRGEFLKERLLGVRVFDRPPDYDTASDPIVRVTIAEVRKRIAQYYHEEEHDAEMRIELLPGSYVPQFRPRHTKRDSKTIDFPNGRNSGVAHRDGEPETPVSALVPISGTPTQLSHSKPARLFRYPRLFLYVAWPVTLLAAFCLGIWRVPLYHLARPTPRQDMWSPLLSTSHAILLCFPTDAGNVKLANGAPVEPAVAGPSNPPALGDQQTAEPSFRNYEVLGQNIVYSDMLATLKITNYLVVNHHDYQMRSNVITTLEDLQQAPAVLVGGIDNQWTMRALAPLRFHFNGADQDRYWIQDSHTPSDKRWSLDPKQPLSSVTRDYAIIARLHNQQTGQPELIVAGIGMSGTAAAGEFITDGHRLQDLSHQIGAGFKTRDFEIVISTDVINGMSGVPKVLAVQML